MVVRIAQIVLVMTFAFGLCHSTNGQSVKGDVDPLVLAERMIQKGEFSEATTLLDSVISANPQNYPAYAMRGFCYFLRGQLDSALDDFDTALRLAPLAQGAEKVHNNRGVVYQMKGNLEKALRDFDKAISINKNYPEPYNGRGVVLEKKGRIDEALAAFEKAIELNPKVGAAYEGRADIRFWKNDFAGAVADYNKIIESFPDSPATHVRRGMIRGLEGRWELCVADLRRGFMLANKVRPSTGLFLPGTLSVTFSDLDRYIENNNKTANVFAIRGFVNLLRNRDKEAQDDFDRSFSIDEKLKSTLDDIIESVKLRRV